MTFDELQNELRNLIGESVAFKRIAGNSIIVYFHGEPGDESVVSIFIAPTWRYENGGKVCVGSYDLQLDESDFASEDEYSQAFERLCSLTDGLVGARLVDCAVDSVSSDLTLAFAGGQVLRNFANSAFETGAWTYRDLPGNLEAGVSPSGVIIDKFQ